MVHNDQCLPVNITDCSCILYSHNRYRQASYKPGDISYKHDYVGPTYIFDDVEIDVGHYWPNVWCLIALSVFYRMVAYLVLCFKYRNANR